MDLPHQARFAIRACATPLVLARKRHLGQGEAEQRPKKCATLRNASFASLVDGDLQNPALAASQPHRTASITSFNAS